MRRDIYFITPLAEGLPEDPPLDLIKRVCELLNAEGYDLRCDDERSFIFDKIVEGIKKNGITHYTNSVRLIEAVLPDGAPQEECLSLLQSMVRTIAPKK